MSKETFDKWKNRAHYALMEESLVCETDDLKDTLKNNMIEGSATMDFLTVGMFIAIIAIIQLIIFKIYSSNKNTYRALTHFVTTMLGLIMGGYIANLFVLNPSHKIMSEQESMIIVGFIKDICLMVFAYYFGTQSNSDPSEK